MRSRSPVRVPAAPSALAEHHNDLLWRLWEEDGAAASSAWMLGAGLVAAGAWAANAYMRRLMRRLRL